MRQRNCYQVVIIIMLIIITNCNNINAKENLVEVKAGTNKITVDYNYYINKYEVTNLEFVKFLNQSNVSATGIYNNKLMIKINSPYQPISYKQGDFSVSSDKENYPVIGVTWYGAVSYCNWLSEQNNLAKTYSKDWKLKKQASDLEGYRLPLEDEWEYAARGGSQGQDTIYAGSDKINEVAWHWNNSQNSENDIFLGRGPHVVGDKQGNQLKIYDMSGNVLEWCNDWQSPSKHKRRILRGGSWFYKSYAAKVDYYNRIGVQPEISSLDNGFRIVRTSKGD
ncbi:hypothetical protein JCM16358_10760 [Halanaerocella petrolearia]